MIWGGGEVEWQGIVVMWRLGGVCLGVLDYMCGVYHYDLVLITIT